MEKTLVNLTDKIVIVTGGAAGIGKHIASVISACGAKVMIFDRNVENGTRLEGMECFYCDVTSKTSVCEAVERVAEKYQRIDALINNAGVLRPQLLVDIYGTNPEYEIDENSFDFMFQVNVKGLMFCSQAVAKQQIKQGKGVVVNISSESGMEGSAGQSIYAATKGAVNALTRSWAKELGSKNLRFVAIAPGIMEKTDMRTDAYNQALAYTRGTLPENLNDDYSKSIPLRRAGKLDEVGYLAAFLISDQAEYITGTTLNISGGKSRG